MRRACVLLTALIGISCAKGAGRVSVHFEWESRPPPAAERDRYWLHASVEERRDLDTRGTILRTATTQLGAAAALALAPVPNGAHRVAIVEVTEGEDLVPDRIRYFGMSNAFSLEAGRTTTVEVRIRIKRVPEVAPVAEESAGRCHGGSGLLVKEARADCLVKDPAVTLEIATSEATSFEIAQNPTFTIADQLISAASAGARSSTIAAGVSIYTLAYDLCGGERGPRACPDGPRTLFARVFNAQHYASEVLRATVTLDRQGPRVVARSAGLVLIPRADNVLLAPSSAREGTTARATFTFDKPTDPATLPLVTSEGPSATLLTFECINSSGTTFVCEHTFSRLDPEGTYALAVTAVDRSGNSGTSPLPSIVVKHKAPPAPDVDKITYHRTPWGSRSSGGVPSFTISATVGAAAPQTQIVPYDALDVRIGNTTARVRSDGSFGELALEGGDREDVRVAATDDAGNLSEEVRVRNVAWTATLWRKVQGSRTPNPHRITTATDAVPTLSHAATEPTTRSRRVFSATGTAALEARGGDRWKQVAGTGTTAPARAYHAMTYDAARGRVVLFGGWDGRLDALSDTWEWDGSRWFEHGPASSPPARRDHAMAYDAVRGRVVLFGGRPNGQMATRLAFADTWEWDGSNWIERRPSSPPPARYGHAMAYDAARGRIVLFGGYGKFGGLRETWEWDGTEWIKRRPPSSPPPRFWHAMAYDAARGRVVLFGGLGGGPPGLPTDTWEWDGSSWLERRPPSLPPGRIRAAMAYDATRGCVVLFGGDGSNRSLADNWEWNGSDWIERRPSSLPPARLGHAMAYDAARGRIVLFGGLGSNRPLADTWEWDGSFWVNRHAQVAPPGRQSAAMAYDAARGRVVLFGGRTGSSPGADTWEWDGSNWLERQPPTSPPARRFHAMAYDTARGRVVLFGGSAGPGFLSDTWEWDGSDWVELRPEPSPPAREAHAMAYDAARGHVVLFGGSVRVAPGFADTWEWDGSDWLELKPESSPPAREGHAMAYDAARGRVLMFGGLERVNIRDTWEWDGSSWLERRPSSSPRARHYHAMTYDAGRGRIVLFGGEYTIGTGGLLADTWEWDGSNWLERYPTFVPPARSGHGMTYEAPHRRSLLFGGSLSGDTWELDFARRPSVLVDIDWGASGTSSAAIDRVTLTATMGGRGYSTVVPGTGAPRLGAAAQVWDAHLGRWIERMSNNAGVETTATSTAVMGGVEAQRLIDQDKQVHFRVQTVSSSGNGPETARVALDYVEVTVEYRIGAGAHPRCGNGRVELHAGELCDDGNAAGGDGCSSACIPEPGWTCAGSPSVCFRCGNGVIEGTEECDDGNELNGDGCNDVCRIEAGWACSGQPSQCRSVPIPSED